LSAAAVQAFDDRILGPGERAAIRQPPDDHGAACLKDRGDIGAAASRRRMDATLRTPATNAVRTVFHRSMDARDPADAELAARLAADLDGSFEALVLAHQDRLFTIAHRVGGDRSDAEELVQDTFVRAYRAMGGFPPTRVRELRLRGWLTTILLNAGRNRSRVRRVSTTELVFEPGSEPTVDALTRRDEREMWGRLLAG
jgi:hypothetical protein